MSCSLAKMDITIIFFFFLTKCFPYTPSWLILTTALRVRQHYCSMNNFLRIRNIPRTIFLRRRKLRSVNLKCLVERYVHLVNVGAYIYTAVFDKSYVLFTILPCNFFSGLSQLEFTAFIWGKRSYGYKKAVS